MQKKCQNQLSKFLLILENIDIFFNFAEKLFFRETMVRTLSDIYDAAFLRK